MRGIFILGGRRRRCTEWEGAQQREEAQQCDHRARHAVPLQRKGEDCQVAFAGEDNGQEAAVEGDVEFANGEAVEERLRRGLENGDGIAGFLRGEFGKGDPDEVAGFSFDSALEHDAIFVGRPMENAEAHAQVDKVIRSGEVANLQHFSVDEIGDFFAAG